MGLGSADFNKEGELWKGSIAYGLGRYLKILSSPTNYGRIAAITSVDMLGLSTRNDNKVEAEKNRNIANGLQFSALLTTTAKIRK